MRFEDILSEWKQDSHIDKTALDDEAIKIPKLHHKYYTMLITEKAILRKLESEMKVLELDKHEFYTMGHTDETREKGWKLPPKGMILKADIPMYMRSDPDIIDLSLKIGIAQEKVEFLESVIKSFQNRGFNIKTAVDFIKFTNGS
jgi:hypothetical protein